MLDEEEEPQQEPPPSPPPITAEELEAARAAAHAEGLAEGLAAAEEARSAERAALLAAVSAQLVDADAKLRMAVDEAGAALSRLVLATVQSGFPALGARHGAAEIARFTREVTALLAAEPRIVIRVNPAMVAVVGEVLATLEPERREAVLVEARETLAAGDARIAWRHGLAVRDTAQLRARIDAVLAPLGLSPAGPDLLVATDPAAVVPTAEAPVADAPVPDAPAPRRAVAPALHHAA